MSPLATQAIEALASFTGATRLYELRIGATELLVEAFRADDALGAVGTRALIVLATSAFVDLDSLLGESATLSITLADGSRTRFHGEIHEAAALGSDGGLARYRLLLSPWTWRLAHGCNARVWQDLSVVAIVDDIFDAYRPAARWRWSAEVTSFLATTPPRSYCCQYRESDLAFVRRLLDEEGLSWRFEQDDDGAVMVLFADSTSPAALPAACTVRYHAASALERQDGVQALETTRTLQASLATLLSADYKSRRSVSAAAPSPLGAAGLQVLEDYDVPGQYAFADRAHAHHQANLRMQAHEALVQPWRGRSTVRTLCAGSRLDIADTPLRPRGDDLSLAVVRTTSVGINNLPPAASVALAVLFGPSAEMLGAQPDDDVASVLEQASRSGYANRFEAIPSEVPWRVMAPTKPTAPGTQSAIVVGPDGGIYPNGADELHCDRLGRVRIRFHWQDDGLASCWVRVAQRAAGGGVGSQFLPRIGQEVLVQFFENDIDRPIIVGALYNGRGEGGITPTPGGAVTASDDSACFAVAHDHGPSGQGNHTGGNSPVWHGAAPGSDGHRNAAAQWGVRSKEFGGSGYNQLLFDDTDGQGRVQLRCSHAGTELNLGHLVHGADNYRGSFRGLGAELRSDAGGAVRAGAGLLVSSYGIDHGAAARDPVGSNDAGVGLLQQALQLAKAFHEVLVTHQTVGLAAHAGALKAGSSVLDERAAPLAAMLAAVSGTVDGDGGGALPQLKEPLVVVAAKDGIGATAGQGLQLTIGETVTMMSGVDVQAIVGGALRVHAGQAIGVLGGLVKSGEDGVGLQLIASKEMVDIQAQADELRVQARNIVDVVSVSAHIDWAAAKQISLSTVGGASVVLSDGNISVQCPGKLKISAGKKNFQGPAQSDYVPPPGNQFVDDNIDSFNRFDEQFHLVDRDDQPLANAAYRIVASTGQVFEGVTNAEGLTKRIKTKQPAKLEIELVELFSNNGELQHDGENGFGSNDHV